MSEQWSYEDNANERTSDRMTCPLVLSWQQQQPPFKRKGDLLSNLLDLPTAEQDADHSLKRAILPNVTFDTV